MTCRIRIVNLERFITKQYPNKKNNDKKYTYYEPITPILQHIIKTLSVSNSIFRLWSIKYFYNGVACQVEKNWRNSQWATRDRVGNAEKIAIVLDLKHLAKFCWNGSILLTFCNQIKNKFGRCCNRYDEIDNEANVVGTSQNFHPLFTLSTVADCLGCVCIANIKSWFECSNHSKDQQSTQMLVTKWKTFQWVFQHKTSYHVKNGEIGWIGR